MELKSTGDVVGNIDVNTVVKKHNYCNVGYTVRYKYWGNGYASEALKAVSDYLLDSGYYLVECSKLGGCKFGEAKMTDAYKLPCKKIIHTVGPIYNNPDHENLLKNCYINSLKLAEQYRIENKLDNITIGFPCISTGLFGYPKDEASKIAIDIVRKLDYKNITVVFACYEVTDYQEYVNNAYGIFIDYMG